MPERCCEEAESKPSQTVIGDAGLQPAGGAGVEQERMDVTKSESRPLNSLSNESHSSQPSDSGEKKKKWKMEESVLLPLR